MSPWPWLLIAAAFLVLPRLLLPTRPRPEVHRVLWLLWWLNAFYCAFWHRLKSQRAPLPAEGAAILIANHTCGIDNFLLQAGCRRVLRFLIAQEFYEFWACRPFCRLLRCIPVKRDGRDTAATRAALRALEQGRVVPIFPEGRINPTSGRTIGPGKPGVAFLALRAGVPVVPAYIRGTPETNDVFRALRTPSCARVVYGEPIDLSTHFPRTDHPDRETLDAVTEFLMDAIRSLRDPDPVQARAAGPEPDTGPPPVRRLPDGSSISGPHSRAEPNFGLRDADVG